MFVSPLKFASRTTSLRQGLNVISKGKATLVFHPTRFLHRFAARSAPVASFAPLGLGLAFGVAGSVYYCSQTVYHNDAVAVADSLVNEAGRFLKENKPAIVKQRFGGKLNYHELSIGSISGLLLGVLVGKLSHILVFISVTGYLGLQYLQSKGLISLPPINRVVKVAGDRVDVDELIWNNQSFKLSFVSAFMIAAFNV